MKRTFWMVALLCCTGLMTLAASPAGAQSCPKDVQCTDPDYESCQTDACNTNYSCWEECSWECNEDPENCTFSTCSSDCDNAYSTADSSCWATHCFVWWAATPP